MSSNAGSMGNFDRFNFRRRMEKLGRAYRNRAMVLIAICRLFSEAAEQGFMQDADLTGVLKACDRALSRAVEARDGLSQASDESIDEAIRELHGYQSKYHPDDLNSDKSVRKRMSEAKQKESGGLSLNRLLGKGTKTNTAALRVVEFRLIESLPSAQPIILRQEITDYSKPEEILWNFSRCDGNRLTLAKNPYFYNCLPHTSSNTTWDEFTLPIHHNWHQNPIYILTNIPGRIFFESDRYPRAFDNVWKINGILVFKGICGRLGNEQIVGKFIQGRPCFWCLVESPLPQPAGGPVAIPPNHAWKQLQDWREAIHILLTSESRDIKIRIAEHNT